MNKLEIKTFCGSVLFSYKAKYNTIKKTVEEAVKEGADLRRADLRRAKNIPMSIKNLVAKDLLYIFTYLKSEVPFLRKKLIEGKVDGTQYKGSCACLIGTIANAEKTKKVDDVCSAIPFYEKGLLNAGEMWFFNIREGDTPENSEFAKFALELIDMSLGGSNE